MNHNFKQTWLVELSDEHQSGSQFQTKQSLNQHLWTTISNIQLRLGFQMISKVNHYIKQSVLIKSSIQNMSTHMWIISSSEDFDYVIKWVNHSFNQVPSKGTNSRIQQS